MRLADADGVLERFAALVRELPREPGLSGAHLLRTDAPAIAPTTEQALRGHADRAADWIFVVNGYDLDALRACSRPSCRHCAQRPLACMP